MRRRPCEPPAVVLGAGPRLLVRVTPDAVARLGLALGAKVLALVKSMAIEVLPAA